MYANKQKNNYFIINPFKKGFTQNPAMFYKVKAMAFISFSYQVIS
jgi:hypothetical protein